MLPKCSLQDALKKRAGIVEVLFGVGLGNGDPLKRFIKQAHNALLLRE